MRVFKILMLIAVLSVSFSLKNVSAKEGDFESIHKKYPNAVHVLTENNQKEAKKLEQKVLEDMKNNPDKVEYAVPVDVMEDDSVSSYASLPYEYEFSFLSSTKKTYFTSYSGYTRLFNRMKVDSAASVRFSVYKQTILI